MFQTALHYAVLSPEPQLIVRHLLDSNASVMENNEDGDTVIHYAIKHCNDLLVFRILLSKMTYSDLSYENDVGMSVLHVAINEQKFMFAKAIIQHIDDCLQIRSLDYDIWDEPQLIGIYKDYVANYIKQEQPEIQLNPKKMELINHRERKGGRTALFFATIFQSEPLVYMLLAHLADPRIIDMSDVTCSFFTSDMISNRVLTAAIYNAEYLYKYRIEPSSRGNLTIDTVRKRKSNQNASKNEVKISKLDEST